ncbi:MAG: hypothetical protein JNK82_41160 [Myxococcaceae bacterium]|nr:hypothetical protein [Myxococcaceae bacterium]
MNRTICFAALAACSSSPPSPVSLEALCGAFARADCERSQACGHTSSQVDCARLEQVFLSDCISIQRQKLDAGLVQYDPVAAGACVRSIRGGTCDLSVFPRFHYCPDAFPGPSAEGEPCGDCQAGLNCNTAARCATCVRRSPAPNTPSGRAVGEPCFNPILSGDLCEVAAYCAAAGDGGFECAARATRDEACDARPCHPELACLGSTCRPRLDVGGACDGDDCLQGLRCVEGQCRPIAYSGEACVNSQQCAYGSGLPCVNGTCASPAPLGSSCDAGECELAAYCNDQWQCVPRVERDGACVTGFECALGTLCADPGDGGRRCAGPSSPACIP